MSDSGGRGPRLCYLLTMASWSCLIFPSLHFLICEMGVRTILASGGSGRIK